MDIQLSISFNSETKNVSVTGPTDDLGLCHLMLDLARQSLFAHTMRQVTDRRIVAPNGPMPLPKPQ